MRLGDLLSAIPEWDRSGPVPEWATVRISDVTDDSRSVVPGSLFIARRGHGVDARRFIPDALRAGAVAVVADRGGGFDPGVLEPSGAPIVMVDDAQRAGAFIAESFHQHPSRTLRIVAATGTNGKTTVTSLVHQLLNRTGIRCGLIGTVVTDDGRCVGESSQTTPGAIELSQTLATMVDSGCSAAALEVSSHALHQGRVQALHIQLGVFTNLSGDHLDYHATMDEYADSKARLFAMLPADGLAVVNAMDPMSARMLRDCHARVLRTGIAGATWDDGLTDDAARVEILAHSTNGTRIALHGPWGTMEATIPLFGEHNAMNALQATAVAIALGADSPGVRRALSLITPPRGRLDPVEPPRHSGGAPADPAAPMVLVDYAHTDDALRNALRAMQPIAQARSGRLIVAFGCGGNRDTTKRPRMGRIASELADLLVITSDNPRHEKPSDIIAAILDGIPASRRDAVLIHADRRTAIEQAINAAGPNDVVVIAGKGHEREQILPDGKGGVVKVPFDDAEVARNALREWHAREHENAGHDNGAERAP